MAGEKKISEILLSIDNDEYTIPEFQRGYVWNSTQVKGFFRSLYLGYPSGSFLIWKTKEPSKIRGEQKESNSIFHQLILDGQQRLTTIYTIFKGKTPDWYEGVSLRTDLYFNIEAEEFEYYMPKKMSNNPEWINVSDFLSKGGVTSFISGFKDMSEDHKNYYMLKLEVLNKLGNITNYAYYIKEITITDIDKVVEIFNLVNKTGTTLNESDLALAIITSNWPSVKDKYRTAIEEYKKHNYDFSFNFFTRCLNILTTERGKFTSDIAEVNEAEFEAAWLKLNKILPHIINILRDNAYIDSSENYNSLYVLYVLVYYLSKNDLNFDSEEEANKAIYWLYTSLLWGRFSGSSESYLEKDMNVIKETNSIDGLINEMYLYRGSNLSLRPDDLALQGIRSRIYNLFYCAIRAQNAKDWTNPAISLYSKNMGYNNKLQMHHIFPKAFLYKKLNSSNSIHKAMVNEISNMSFITQQSNIEILDKDPALYLPEIPTEQLRKQFVPTDPQYYTIERYEEFLEERRKLLCNGLNKFLDKYYINPEKSAIPEDLTNYNDDIETIEFALRDLIDQKLNEAAEEDPYIEFISQNIREKVDGRLLNWLMKNPGEDSTQFKSIRRKLDFFDLQEYKDIIVSKPVWQVFESNFGSKSVLENRFNQLAELRNSIRHSRDITEATLKDGEAAISWFNSVLRSIIKPNQLIIQD
jgi:hypothetical protein